MLNENQKILLVSYKEKCFINSILAEETFNYYNFIKNIINIPLIICNSVMVCINSIIEDQELLKILNIILNSSTGLILSLISNFKIYENIQHNHQLHIKFNKLCHQIDSKLTNDEASLTPDYIQSVVEDYDQIIESQEFSFPSKIKKKIKKQYEGKMSLPSSLSVDVVQLCENNKCCVKV